MMSIDIMDPGDILQNAWMVQVPLNYIVTEGKRTNVVLGQE